MKLVFHTTAEVIRKERKLDGKMGLGLFIPLSNIMFLNIDGVVILIIFLNDSIIIYIVDF